MPPIDVYYDGESYWLADGFHRYNALTVADSQQPIKCNVHDGTLEDAKWHSYGANKTHGLPRRNEDKARAVKAALLHTNGVEMSDRQIAEHVGVGHVMVSRHRKKYESTVSLEQSSDRAFQR